MEQVSKLMNMQVSLDNKIAEAVEKGQNLDAVLNELKSNKTYTELEKLKGIGLGEGKGIKWIKTGKNEQLIEGTINEFIKKRYEVKRVAKLTTDYKKEFENHIDKKDFKAAAELMQEAQKNAEFPKKSKKEFIKICANAAFNEKVEGKLKETIKAGNYLGKAEEQLFSKELDQRLFAQQIFVTKIEFKKHIDTKDIDSAAALLDNLESHISSSQDKKQAKKKKKEFIKSFVADNIGKLDEGQLKEFEKNIKNKEVKKLLKGTIREYRSEKIKSEKAGKLEGFIENGQFEKAAKLIEEVKKDKVLLNSDKKLLISAAAAKAVEHERDKGLSAAVSDRKKINKKTRKLLSKEIEIAHSQDPFEKWTRKGAKLGGMGSESPLEGIYQNDKAEIGLVKNNKDTSKNMNEFLGGRFHNAIYPASEAEGIPSSGAEIRLLQTSEEAKKGKGEPKKVCAVSMFLPDNPVGLFTDIENSGVKVKAPEFMVVKDEEGNRERVYAAGNFDKRQEFFKEGFKKQQYEGFERIMAVSYFMGNFDMHAANIMVMKSKDKDGKEVNRLAAIDHSWGFVKLGDEIHPHSEGRHVWGFGPTNHNIEYPEEIRLTEQMAKECYHVSNADIDKIVDGAFAELEKVYDDKALAAWAKQAMPQHFDKKKVAKISKADIKHQFKKTMQARQTSMREYGLQIDLGHAMSPDGKEVVQPEKLKELCKDPRNRRYFNQILNGSKKFKFRHSHLKSNSGAIKLLKGELEVALREAEKGLQQSSVNKTIDRSLELLQKEKGITLADQKLFRENMTKGLQSFNIDYLEANSERIAASLATSVEKQRSAFKKMSRAKTISIGKSNIEKILKSSEFKFHIEASNKVTREYARQDKEAKEALAKEEVQQKELQNAAKQEIEKIASQEIPKSEQKKQEEFVKSHPQLLSDNFGKKTEMALDIESEITRVQSKAMKTILQQMGEKKFDKIIAASNVKPLEYKELKNTETEEFADILRNNPELKFKIAEEIASYKGKEGDIMRRAMANSQEQAYAKIMQKYGNDLKDFKWEQEQDARSFGIKDTDGKEVCKLTENTLAFGQEISLNGTTVGRVTSYRIVNLPKETKGKIDMMFVGYNANGRPISPAQAAKGLQYSVHYNDKGKPVGQSHPEPLQFYPPDDKNGFAFYVDKTGGVITFPITKEAYMQNAIEIAKNRGLEFAGDQFVAHAGKKEQQLSQDKVSQGPREDIYQNKGAGWKVNLKSGKKKLKSVKQNKKRGLSKRGQLLADIKKGKKLKPLKEKEKTKEVQEAREPKTVKEKVKFFNAKAGIVENTRNILAKTGQKIQELAVKGVEYVSSIVFTEEVKKKGKEEIDKQKKEPQKKEQTPQVPWKTLDPEVKRYILLKHTKDYMGAAFVEVDQLSAIVKQDKALMNVLTPGDKKWLEDISPTQGQSKGKSKEKEVTPVQKLGEKAKEGMKVVREAIRKSVSGSGQKKTTIITSQEKIKEQQEAKKKVGGKGKG